uniref:Uncharacterized protein n=1 Tax=Anguilla anguilla TaxID=7936 RepID=A0A0E9V7Y4_ANGAN
MKNSHLYIDIKFAIKFDTLFSCQLNLCFLISLCEYKNVAI